MTTDIQPLIFGVEKPIWLATTGPLEDSDSEIIGWTTKEPKHKNGHIDKGSVLLFANISPEKDIREKQPLEFIIIHVGQVQGEYPADFLEEEIDSLTKEGVLTLLDLENIDETSIGLGRVFTKYQSYISGRNLSFDARVFSPRDIYIIMGPEEMRRSNAKIATGEKISLEHLLEVYSIAVGQNWISK
jgi:hypothetical protein